ncbi:hypothetical protein [Oceaniradius stylonematis]|uniref:hypothetical protein n=1 Tax=Oceaniradius stylonematis TaxID=2184161 RepID=UPI003B58F349
MNQPWFKFYPTDWRSDPRLRMCSMAARGLWVEMIALMHEATPYGHLLVAGHSPTDAQLAVLAGAPPDQIPDLIGELETAGVFSRTKEGVVYSRKMTRMAKKSATARRNGKSGGNPSLSKESAFSALDNQEDKPPDKPQKPEARNQKPEDIPDGISENARASDAGFDAFWAIYPHKVGKRDARSAFGRAVKRVPLDVLMAGLRRYVAKTDDRPWCNPATWLNQDRWDDQPAPVPRNRTPPPSGRPANAAEAAAMIASQMRERDYEAGNHGRTGRDVEFLPAGKVEP